VRTRNDFRPPRIGTKMAAGLATLECGQHLVGMLTTLTAGLVGTLSAASECGICSVRGFVRRAAESSCRALGGEKGAFQGDRAVFACGGGVTSVPTLCTGAGRP
jgi:hypothetical protein